MNPSTPSSTPPAESYVTTDLGIGAFLMARGFPLLAITPDFTSRRRQFHFPAEAKAVSPSFYTGGQVEARLFNNSIRNLRTLLTR